MDKNTITGFVLIAAVLFGFSWFSRPSEEEIRAQHQQDSIAAVNKAKQENERKQAEANYIAVMNLFFKLMTPEQQKEIEKI